MQYSGVPGDVLAWKGSCKEHRNTALTITTHAHEYNTRSQVQKKLTSTTHAHEYNTRSRTQKKLTNTEEADDSEQRLPTRNTETLRKPPRHLPFGDDLLLLFLRLTNKPHAC